MHDRPYVLSIAGFDPSSGAGVSADIKSLEANRVRGLGVTTSITFQSGSRFNGIDWLSHEQIQRQLAALFAEYDIPVCKIGLLQSLESLRQIIASLKAANNAIRIIWDPILRASAGFEFHENLDKEMLAQVLEHIDLITPNADEWQRLTALISDAEIASKTAVFLKGGHNSSNATDILYSGGEEIEFPSERLDAKYDKHGTGCALSAAIAAALANGSDLQAACGLAKDYVQRFMLSTESKLGAHFV